MLVRMEPASPKAPTRATRPAAMADKPIPIPIRPTPIRAAPAPMRTKVAASDRSVGMRGLRSSPATPMMAKAEATTMRPLATSSQLNLPSLDMVDPSIDRATAAMTRAPAPANALLPSSDINVMMIKVRHTVIDVNALATPPQDILPILTRASDNI